KFDSSYLTFSANSVLMFTCEASDPVSCLHVTGGRRRADASPLFGKLVVRHWLSGVGLRFRSFASSALPVRAQPARKKRINGPAFEYVMLCPRPISGSCAKSRWIIVRSTVQLAEVGKLAKQTQSICLKANRVSK